MDYKFAKTKMLNGFRFCIDDKQLPLTPRLCTMQRDRFGTSNIAYLLAHIPA